MGLISHELMHPWAGWLVGFDPKSFSFQEGDAVISQGIDMMIAICAFGLSLLPGFVDHLTVKQFAQHALRCLRAAMGITGQFMQIVRRGKPMQVEELHPADLSCIRAEIFRGVGGVGREQPAAQTVFVELVFVLILLSDFVDCMPPIITCRQARCRHRHFDP